VLGWCESWKRRTVPGMVASASGRPESIITPHLELHTHKSDSNGMPHSYEKISILIETSSEDLQPLLSLAN
jgi:hypothetical protein